MSKMFGTDGIRGIANQDLTSTFSKNLGIAIATVLGEEQSNNKIVIGRDTRISGKRIVDDLIAGLTSVGINIIDLGIIPTPAVSYLVTKYQALAGIMVSASHNPSEYNGIKIFDYKGYKISNDEEDKIEKKYKTIEKTVMHNYQPGTILTNYNPLEDYVEYLKNACSIKINNLKIGIDCANGAAYQTADLLFKKLKCQPYIINNTPNGTNINKNCGATHIETLAKYVKENNLDCGIAYDGDADRCIMVDNTGEPVDGDNLLAILAQDLQKEGKLSQTTLVGTIMSNLGLQEFCQKNNITFKKTKVGDRNIIEEMCKNNYNLGGEPSGHIIYKNYSNTSDGELASLKILEIMQKNNQSLKELASVMTKYPQVLINIKVNNNQKNNILNHPKIIELINQTEAKLYPNGRLLVRKSGTEPLIRIMVEGTEQDQIEKCANDLAQKITELL